MFKKIVIFILLMFVISCQKIDDSNNMIKVETTKIKNVEKYKKIKLNSNEKLLEYGINGNYIKGKTKEYPKNGTFIPTYQITLFNKSSIKIDLPVSEVIDIRISKSGNKILYLNKNEQLYYYDLKKKEKILISNSSFPTFQFSNDESKIAYFEGSMPSYNLFLYNIDHKSNKKITDSNFSAWSAGFSEDDNIIYFIYSPNGYPALYKYNLKDERLIEINSKIKLFPSERKPFLIFKNNLIFKNSKNEIVSVDFLGKDKKIISYGEVLQIDKGKITISKNGTISTIKVGKK